MDLIINNSKIVSISDICHLKGLTAVFFCFSEAKRNTWMLLYQTNSVTSLALTQMFMGEVKNKHENVCQVLVQTLDCSGKCHEVKERCGNFKENNNCASRSRGVPRSNYTRGENIKCFVFLVYGCHDNQVKVHQHC